MGEFDQSKETWVAYAERMEQYFTANDIADPAKQRAVLLSACGATTYQLIRNLVAPGKPADKSFAEVVHLVQTHHSPPPSEIVQRFNFHSRSQRDGESIAQFDSELRKLSEHCGFGDSMNDMLRDRLVCGVRDSRVQRRLLSEPRLTYAKAFELAQTAELADKHSKDLSKQLPPAVVHVLQRQNRPSGQSQGATVGYAKCYCCGGGKHTAQDCRFKEADCNNCGKTGHLARVCRSKPKQGGQRQPRHRQPTKKTHHLAEEAAPEHTPAVEEYCLYHVDHKQSSTQPMRVTVEANEADLSMEVDTGAAASVMSEANYKRVWSDVPELPQLRPTTTNLQTYTGEKLRVLGTITVDVSYNEQRAQLSLLVIEGTGPTLMGRDWLTSSPWTGSN